MADIELDIQGQIARLVIDNPSKLNVLTMQMLRQLEAHIMAIEASRDIRLVTLEAAPSKAFCAGADIHEWSTLDPQSFANHWVREGHRIFDRLARLPMPTLAIVEAPVFGGGVELLAAVDWRIFSPNVNLSLPETSIGIVPAWSGTQRLARLLPEPILRAMVLMGRTLSAEEACRFGFADLVENPHSLAQQLMQEICARSPQANQIAKFMLNAAAYEDQYAMIDALAGGLAASMPQKEMGVAAFAEKRKPKY